MKVQDEVDFLGVTVYICEKHGVPVTKLKSKTRQQLAFYSSQLRTALKLTDSTSRLGSAPNLKTLKSVSQSISSFIESRFQYSIAYCDSDTLDYFFNLHKKVISAVLGKPAIFLVSSGDPARINTSPIYFLIWKRYVRRLTSDCVCLPDGRRCLT